MYGTSSLELDHLARLQIHERTQDAKARRLSRAIRAGRPRRDTRAAA
jgi:hypothetical protein